MRIIVQAIFLLLIPFTIQAQEVSDFLECADFSDRLERVICLEGALEEAVSEQDTVAVSDNADSETVENFGNNQAAVSSVPEEQEADEEANESSFFRMPKISLGNIFRRNSDQPEGTIYTPGRSTTESNEQETLVVESNESRETDKQTGNATGSVENFGRESRVIVNDEGQEELLGVVAEIQKIKANLLQITLGNGQIWQQRYVKQYNLREGDSVRIYASGWGSNFRLESERLSGFIQVGRVE